MLPECRREREVAALVRAGRWPDACDNELRAHVATCADCQDVVEITELLQQADSSANVRVPSAAQMWWRLAVRARLEREQAAARPVVWLQGLAAACGIGLAVAALGQEGPVLVDTAAALAGRVVGAVPATVPALTWPGGDVVARMPGLGAAAGAALLLVAATTAVCLWIADD